MRRISPSVIDGVPVTQTEDLRTQEVILTTRLSREWLQAAMVDARGMAESRLRSLMLYVRQPMLGMAAIEEQTIRRRRMWIGKFRLGRWGR